MLEISRGINCSLPYPKFLDAMMANQYGSSTKTLDETLHTIQGRVLEAVGPLSQLLESVNSEGIHLHWIR